MDDHVAVPQNLERVAGHQASSLSSAVARITAHGCFIVNMFLLTPLLCIGNGRLICDDEMVDMAIRVLPQVHCRFYIDEAGIFAELPVRVVGDPPLPVIGINHFLEEAWL